MKKIGIVPNIEKDINLEFTKKAIDWLLGKGCTVYTNEQVAEKLNMPECSADMKFIYEKSDFLLVLGGDGTILRVAKNSALHDTPLLGINLGTLGYLTDVEKGEAFSALERAINDNFKLENRMMLEASILTGGAGNETLIALNEVCISKGVFASMITMKMNINDEYIDDYRADGIIISTPTGSTAYNFSAGGPILKPDIEVISITPICPHMIYTRPSVISADDVIKIKIVGTKNSDALLILDGQTHHPLKYGDEVIVRRSKYYTSIIKTNNKSFYDILRHKIK